MAVHQMQRLFEQFEKDSGPTCILSVAFPLGYLRLLAINMVPRLNNEPVSDCKMSVPCI